MGDERAQPFPPGTRKLTIRSTSVDSSGLLARNSRYSPTSVMRYYEWGQFVPIPPLLIPISNSINISCALLYEAACVTGFVSTNKIQTCFPLLFNWIESVFA